METHKHSDTHKTHHFILPVKTAVAIGTALLILTGVTVGVAHIDLGRFNFVIAMAIATAKALLVGLFFMGLLYDKRENAMIFLTSFVFLGIFITLTGTDLFFRGDIYVKGPLMAAVESKSKIAKPWISSPELIAHGKELFAVQCATCHGAEGKGNGPAASALTPAPRNFTQTEGWKNGRKVTMIFKTLKEGLPPSAMASYATLPADDRWALSHYVASIGTKPETDTAADFAKIGVDPTKESVVEKEAATIPLSLAMKRAAVPETEEQVNALHVYHPGASGGAQDEGASVGAQLYSAHCIQCHGDRGEAGIKVRNLGVNPTAFVTTRSFKDGLDSLKSQQAFTKIVVQGLPGDLMPSMGQLSGSEISELYQHVLTLTK
ncbi:MAG: c-type cytochrome [Bdellovibrionia bacterium]